jgi:hypothetical protein
LWGTGGALAENNGGTTTGKCTHITQRTPFKKGRKMEIFRKHRPMSAPHNKYKNSRY